MNDRLRPALAGVLVLSALSACSSPKSDGAGPSPVATKTEDASKANSNLKRRGSPPVKDAKTALAGVSGDKPAPGVPDQEVAPGVPFYPNSADVPYLDRRGVPGKTVTMSVRATKDSPPKVLDYYEQRLGKPSGASGSETSATAVWNKGKNTVLLAASKDQVHGGVKVSVSVMAGK